MVFKGQGLIWNGEKDCLIRFVDGVYSTNDPEEISYLSSRGYEGEGTVQEPTKAPVKKKKGQA